MARLLREERAGFQIDSLLDYIILTGGSWMRIRYGLVLLVAIALVSLPAAAQQAATNFDLSSVFNADVIVNNGSGGGLDTTQSGVDMVDLCFTTQSASEEMGSGDVYGLPDDGVFGDTPYHPQFHLGYDNADDGNNVWRSTTLGDSMTFSVQAGSYQSVHVFATSGSGVTSMSITLHYSDLSTDSQTVTVPDWFDNISESDSLYYLIDGRDRADADASGYSYSHAAAIFGFVMIADPTKTLSSITIEREDSDPRVLNVFGAAGVIPSGIPALDGFGVVALIVLLAGAALFRMR